MASTLDRSIAMLFRELIDGPDGPAAWMLNGGDVGLLRSLDKLTAASASAAPEPGGSTIAAQVDHIRYGSVSDESVEPGRAQSMGNRGLVGQLASLGRRRPGVGDVAEEPRDRGARVARKPASRSRLRRDGAERRHRQRRPFRVPLRRHQTDRPFDHRPACGIVLVVRYRLSWPALV